MRAIHYIFTFLLFTSAPCLAQGNAVNEYVLDEAIGDLDRDGMEEKVLLVGMKDSLGAVRREIRILKKVGRDWIIWKRSGYAVLAIKEGGGMGDPFEYIEIEKGILKIRQSGGNAWKWGQTDKYRYQHGQFELIGYTSFYGRVCEYWANFDYNISSRKATYHKAFEKCSHKKEKKIKDEREHFKHRLKKTITLENRYESFTTIKVPKLKQEIVF